MSFSQFISYMKSILTNVDVMFYPFIIIVLYGTYLLSKYVISIPIESFITLSIITLGVFGLITFVITKLNNMLMILYKSFNKKKYNHFKDKNGKWEKNKEIDYYKRIVNFKKFFYWNFGLIIILTFIILVPIFNNTGNKYFLLIILYTLLVCDYFLRKFALDFVRKIKIKNTHLYAKAYWEETKLEEFFAPFFQIFLIPIIMFCIIHLNISVYNIVNLTNYFDIFKTILTFSGVFTFIIWLSLILSRLKKKSDTFLEYMFREYFNFILPYE